MGCTRILHTYSRGTNTTLFLLFLSLSLSLSEIGIVYASHI
jgi:hypothetical protein